MDLDAVLARRPQVALVDELAHTNVPGCRNDKRWQDVEELLDAGIDVISTVNIQHLESRSTTSSSGSPASSSARPSPTRSCAAADQIELVDMTPEALRRRMAHGNIYAAREGRRRPRQLLPGRQPRRAAGAGPAVGRRPGRRGAPATTASATASPRRGRPGSGSSSPSPARPSGEHADPPGRPHGQRARTASCSACTSGPTTASPDADDRPRRAPRACSPTSAAPTTRSSAPTSPSALVDFARAENATQLVLGASRRRRWRELLPAARSSTGSSAAPATDRRPRHLRRRDRRRRRRPTAPPVPVAVGPPRCRRGARPPAGRCRAVGHPAAHRRAAGQPRDARSTCRPTCCSTCCWWWSSPCVGGLCAGAGRRGRRRRCVVNWFFTPPVHTWTIAEAENVVALVVFLSWWRWSSACSVEPAVAAVGRRRAGRGRGRGARRAWPAAWSTPTTPLPRSPSATCAPRSASTPWRCCRARRRRLADRGRAPGEPVAGRAPTGRRRRSTCGGGGACWCSPGRRCTATTSGCCSAFAAQLGAALEQRDAAGRGRRQAAAAAEGDRLRTAILRAVSHDLRTPLASIKASVTSLLQDDVDWTPSTTATSSSRPSRRRPTGSTAWSGNLLDMSRLQAGAVEPGLRAGRPRGGRARRARQPQRRRRRAGVEPSTCPTSLPPVRRRPGPARAGGRQPGRQRPAPLGSGRRPVRVEARPRRRRGSTSGSSTTAPGIPPATASACSSRSSASATARADSGRRPRPRRRPRLRRRHGRRARASTTRPAAGLTVVTVCRSPVGRRSEPVTACWSSTTSRRSAARSPPTCGPAATRSTLAATGEEALRLVGRPPPRRRHPRPRPARHRRHRGGRAACGAGADGADRRAVGARAPSATRSRPSTPAPTTTSPSRSAWTSCWPGCGPRCAARRRPTTSRVVDTADFTVDLAAKRVRAGDGDVEVHLTPDRVGRCVELLVRNAGQARDPAPAAAGGVGPELRATETNYLRVHMAPLRRKLEPDPAAPALLPHRAGHGLPLRVTPTRASEGGGAQLAEGDEQLADGVVVLERVPQRGIGVDLVTVAAALTGAGDVALGRPGRRRCSAPLAR